MPVTPMADSASLTSSSLNGLMIAVTSFMCFPRLDGASARRGPVFQYSYQKVFDR
jgi:hypothetical protein